MLNLAIIVSALSVIATGLVIVGFGDWHKFALKFAATVISTVSSAGFIALSLRHPSIINCGEFQEIYIGFGSCIVAKNLSIILFHVATGRDAIQFKHRDRRRV